MSKQSKQRARLRKGRYAKPSPPRMIGANDNHPAAVNDNAAPVTIRGVRLTENQSRRFAVAQDQMSSPRLDDKRAGQRTMEALEREIEVKLTAEHVSAALEERRGLEALRGYTIGRSRVEGAVGVERIARDGLETLTAERTDRKTNQPIPPALDRIQGVAAYRYRADYEKIDPEKKLSPKTLFNTDIVPKRGGDHWDDKRREIERRVWSIQAMICGLPADAKAMPNLDPKHPDMRAIEALNQIAGKGRNLGELSSSGSVRMRILEDLKHGLEAAAIVYGLV